MVLLGWGIATESLVRQSAMTGVPRHGFTPRRNLPEPLRIHTLTDVDRPEQCRFFEALKSDPHNGICAFTVDGDSTMNKERDMSENESGSGFVWFLAGLGVGALVGVLYAPKAGRDTRDDLLAASLDAKDKAAALAQQGRERAGELADQGKQQVGEYVDRGKEYYDKGRTQWSQYVDKGKDLVQDQQNKVSAAVDAGKQAYTSTTQEGQPQKS